ncbi:unnamed protein product [Rotaria socialis]|uniref:Polymerase nucleotidyl transferase domain-containing protein n=1 Tax=Rotaria socialis TaxID=392032 RepID=A0A820KG53_9BILA|nr:unnamed protein product [Rotaria socialis]
MNQSNCLSSSDIDQFAQRFDKPDVVQAIILAGSYAHDEADPHSDIDLVRSVSSGSNLLNDGTYLHEKKMLTNLLTVKSEEYTKWFTDPCEATKWIAGIRIARAIIDRENFFFNGLQMVAWCEEAHKGLEGLRRNDDIGLLLNACHGLSWGL